jgi:AcrR family transcriptional regulator
MKRLVMKDTHDGSRKKVNTKQKIIESAIIMFSEYGYYRVSTRDIANAVHIKSASLYSHFASKDDILTSIYDLYKEKMGKVLPDLDELYKLAETAPPFEVLTKTNFFFEPEDQEIMDRVVTIAAVESRTDKRSEEFLKECIFSLPINFTAKLLERMLELGRIEPLDIDAFVVLLANFCFSAAIRNFTVDPITMEDWMKGTSLLYQMVKPTGK